MRFCVRGSLECPWFELHLWLAARLFQPGVHLLIDVALRHGELRGGRGRRIARRIRAAPKRRSVNRMAASCQLECSFSWSSVMPYFSSAARYWDALVKCSWRKLRSMPSTSAGGGFRVAADAHLVADELLVDEALGGGLAALRGEVEGSLVEEGFEAGFLEDFGFGDDGVADDYGDAVDDGGGEETREESDFEAKAQRSGERH